MPIPPEKIVKGSRAERASAPIHAGGDGAMFRAAEGREQLVVMDSRRRDSV
jgi:hypothetical protein